MGGVTILAWQEAERPQAAGGLRPVLTDARGDQAVSSSTRLSLRSRSLRPRAMRHRCGRYMGLGLDTPLYLICHPLVLAMNYLPRIAVMPMNVIVSAGKGVLDREVYLGGRRPGVTRGLTFVAGTDRAGLGRAPTPRPLCYNLDSASCM